MKESITFRLVAVLMQFGRLCACLLFFVVLHVVNQFILSVPHSPESVVLLNNVPVLT